MKRSIFVDEIPNTAKEYVREKLRTNPELFGGDKSNTAIQQTYIDDIGVKTRKDLTDGVIRTLVTLSRTKNLVLREELRKLDKRDKNKKYCKLKKEQEEALNEQQAS